ncbi:major facilitator superfamily domain-containing protein [Apodospora peruviana]|uniref:Major facilitator superfamily domain-containing protein n=1 Tax=Apodospora peruviana TaxID=516989 RepID=A0AAE0I1Y2_9PEZI|nr:major facilitator superfamily domain-containing protein [Apodospora peruviana]
MFGSKKKAPATDTASSDPPASLGGEKEQHVQPNDTATNSLRKKSGEDLDPGKQEEQAQETEPADQVDESQYLTGASLALVMAAIMAATFLVALDRTIIATAVPRISSDFHSLEDITWYASAYLITSCGTQLIWGRVFSFYSTKLCYLAAILVFEIGSTVCGAAPTSVGFIVGRALAGTGSAGIFSGSTVILTHILPLLGGAFTDKVTWRWCFYINLPIGAVVVAILVLFLHVKHEKLQEPLSRQLIRLDPLGTIVFLPGVVSFLLALQWGGTTYAWNSSRVIALFCVAGVLIIAFIGIQIWRQEDATIPPLYLLPIWFQAVKGTTAVQSGIDTIPMVLGLVLGAIISGAIITNTGYYVPWMFVSTVLMSVGAGLTTTFKIDTGSSAWIGYQAMFGLGLGCGMQQPGLAAQVVLSQADVSIGVAIMFFSNSLGGAIFSSIAQSLFVNKLGSDLPSISGIDVEAIIRAGATQLTRVVPDPAKLAEVLLVYNDAIVNALKVAAAVGALQVLPALGMEHHNIKGKEIMH